MARVIMRHAKNHACLLSHLVKFLGLGQIKRHWLIAHDVEPRVGERLGDLEVQVVRRGNGNKVNPLRGRQLGFPGQHLLVRPVGAVRLDIVIGR